MIVNDQLNVMETPVNHAMATYRDDMKAELEAILLYWSKNSCDHVNGGFVGRIDENNVVDNVAPKGSVLNSRILWAFSSAYAVTGNDEHLQVARTAYNYIVSNFIDKTHGGVYWLLKSNGEPLDTKKQLYALAFAIYGCCAYFNASGNEAAKNRAIELYHTIEQYSYDHQYTGYLEAFTRDWQPLDDLRLSKKDVNEKKTMNTHLHILEAYTALYRVWPDDLLKQKIILLITNFTEHIIDRNNHHLLLFFDEQWNAKSGPLSYGHDIEAAWLLQEAAEAIKDLSLINRVKKIAVSIADAAAGGLDKDGGLWYEYEPSANHFNKEKHSWVQAEAMVGFFNCWQITGNDLYLGRSVQAWYYVKSFIKDRQYGEWYWGRNEDGSVMQGQDKAGIWKCPYHNSRACIEIITRIDKQYKQVC